MAWEKGERLKEGRGKEERPRKGRIEYSGEKLVGYEERRR
jgi:hypothetical protein